MQYTNKEMSALLNILLVFSRVKNEGGGLTEEEQKVINLTVDKAHIPDDEIDAVLAGMDEMTDEESLDYLIDNLDSDKARFALAAVAEICTANGEQTEQQQEFWEELSESLGEGFRSMGWAKVHFAAR